MNAEEPVGHICIHLPGLEIHLDLHLDEELTVVEIIQTVGEAVTHCLTRSYKDIADANTGPTPEQSVH